MDSLGLLSGSSSSHRQKLHSHKGDNMDQLISDRALDLGIFALDIEFESGRRYTSELLNCEPNANVISWIAA